MVCQSIGTSPNAEVANIMLKEAITILTPNEIQIVAVITGGLNGSG